MPPEPPRIEGPDYHSGLLSQSRPPTLKHFESPVRMDVLYSPQFSLHQETKMTAHLTQQSTAAISLKNRD